MFRALLCPSSGASILPAFAKQAKDTYNYRNIKQKLHKTTAAIWFNKTCRERGLTPNYTTRGKPEAANAGRVEAPDDGHKSARNM
jgi:hypothetical protein